MARKSKSTSTIGRGDYRYLIQPRGGGTTWYVSVSIPRPLRSQFRGKKALVRSLQTTNVEEARAARWGAVKDLKEQIDRVLEGSTSEAASLHRQALEWRDYLRRDLDPEEREIAVDRLIQRAEEIAHRILPVPLNESEPELPQEARNFFDLATGKATPIVTYVDRWLDGTTYTDRTKADARTAINQLVCWCESGNRPAFLERIDDRAASDFRDEVFTGKANPKTANKKLSLLRQYWDWLDKSFAIRPNPWRNKSLPKVKAHRLNPEGPDAPERPFTDDELLRLLASNADADLADIMRIAALSGMRLDEIGQLRIGDCREGVFQIRRGKTEAAVRSIPIHSDLRKIIERRMGKRGNLEFLFLNLSNTGWDGNRTMAVSKRFTYFRRRLDIDDRRPGARRSKVNFHSFRRWFATKAEEAGNRENVVAAVMGHAKAGITFGLYSQAELMKLKRDCVESVKLPKATPKKTDRQTVRRNVSGKENSALTSAVSR